MEDLSKRVEALQAQVRRLRVTALLGLAIGMMTLLTGAAYSQREGLWQVPANRVASRSFVLVGEDGSTVYARWTVRGGEPVLNFYNEAGKVVWSAPPKASTKPLDTN